MTGRRPNRPSSRQGRDPVLPTVVGGLAGAIAMIPPGVVLDAAGFEVNRYGVILARQLTGSADRPVLLGLHLLIGIVSAVPLGVARGWWRGRPSVWLAASGAVYGASYWLVVNALALPWLYARPRPWAEGAAAVWPSLAVHVIYGVVTTLIVLGWYGRGRRAAEDAAGQEARRRTPGTSRRRPDATPHPDDR